MAEDIYRKLQQRLDTYSMGFPATDSGIEIRILKHLFSEDDAGLFLTLTPRLETPEAAAPRLGLPVETAAARMEDMARRGLLFRLETGGRVKYGTVPFVHGLFEFQVKNLDRDLAEMVGRYSEEAFDRAMQHSADYFLRTVPVQRSVDLTQSIARHEDAVAMLRGKTGIVVTDCICRKKMAVTEGACAKPLEACFMFGSMGQYYLDRGMGRKIDVEEAVSILTRCQEAGLVTQPSTSQNPAGMCNCCGDCCGVLRALNKHPRPAQLVFSNHFAVVDRGACSGCEACLDRCQMHALEMDDDGRAVLDTDRCIGCGLCVAACPAEALKLVPKPGERPRVPPASTAEQMQRMAQKRGLL